MSEARKKVIIFLSDLAFTHPVRSGCCGMGVRMGGRQDPWRFNAHAWGNDAGRAQGSSCGRSVRDPRPPVNLTGLSQRREPGSDWGVGCGLLKLGEPLIPEDPDTHTP